MYFMWSIRNIPWEQEMGELVNDLEKINQGWSQCRNIVFCAFWSRISIGPQHIFFPFFSGMNGWIMISPPHNRELAIQFLHCREMSEWNGDNIRHAQSFTECHWPNQSICIFLFTFQTQQEIRRILKTRRPTWACSEITKFKSFF